MNNYTSTLDEEQPTSRLCVVYDGRDGRIVHMHEFIGDGTGLYAEDANEDRARLALETVKVAQGTVEHLEVLHPSEDFHVEPDAVHRVERGRVVIYGRVAVRDLIDSRAR